MSRLTITLLLLLLFSIQAAEDHLFLYGDFPDKGQYGRGFGAFSVSARDGKCAFLKEENGNGYLNIKVNPGRPVAVAAGLTFPRRQFAGKIYELRGRIRGKGVCLFSFDLNRDFQGVKIPDLPKIPLTAEWQKFFQKVDMTSVVPDKMRILVRAEGPEGTELDLDDLELVCEYDENVTITPEIGCPVLPENSLLPPQPFRVTGVADGTEAFFVYATPDDKTTRTSTTIREGFATFTAAGQPLAPGVHRLLLVLKGVSVYRDFVAAPADICDDLAAAAAKVRMARPEHWLYLADSLSDFSRGHNHIDIALYFINQANPGNPVTYRNAACGGDQIPRVRSRLTGNSSCYRHYMYEGIYSPVPDRVFFFLGHNDTVAFKETDFQKPQFSIQQVEEAFRLSIDMVKENAPQAQFNIYSAVSTPQEVNERMAKSLGYRFGIPALEEAYNAAVEKIATDYHAQYIDLYTPMTKLQDKAHYFRPDGIHLAEPGQLLVARLFLQALANDATTAKKPLQ